MNVKEEVIKIMAESLKCKPEELQDDTAIGDLQNWDSLQHLVIISDIEKRFGFRFTPDVLMDLEDVGDIVKAVEDRVKA